MAKIGISDYKELEIKGKPDLKTFKILLVKQIRIKIKRFKILIYNKLIVPDYTSKIFGGTSIIVFRISEFLLLFYTASYKYV